MPLKRTLSILKNRHSPFPYHLFLCYPSYIIIQHSIGKMGSSPSYEVQNDSLQQPALRPKRASHPGKDSVCSTKNIPLTIREEPNPEQENQHLPSSPQEQPLLSQHGTPSQKDQPRIAHNAPQAVRQQNPLQEPPKKASPDVPLPEKWHLEAQNAEEPVQPTPREMHLHRQKRKRHTGADQLEREEGELHDRSKIRHYVKTISHQQPLPPDDTSSINRSQAFPMPPRKSPQLDYKQFDSIHIRHKAMQELVQAEYHPHQRPIIAREPIYEHQLLYPKILKNNHREPKDHSDIPTPNRHYQHQRNIQEEAYEQPHKLQLYKRHIFRPHPDEHDAKQLQKSMEVRPHPEEENRGSMGQIRPKAAGLEGQRCPKGKSLPKNEEMPPQVNFRKRKASMPADIDKAQVHVRSKWQQLEEKSIADINKEKQFNISEYQLDPKEMKTCHAGCGRKFTSDRIAKHETVCKLVQQRRDAFNAQDHRIISKQQRKFLKRNKGGAQHQTIPNNKSKGIPKWKAQSIALRAHIKLGMDSQYTPTAEQQQMLSQEHHIDIVTCPVCQRNFNKNSAKTHIPFCKAQLEKQLERERFEKPKTKR